MAVSPEDAALAQELPEIGDKLWSIAGRLESGKPGASPHDSAPAPAPERRREPIEPAPAPEPEAPPQPKGAERMFFFRSIGDSLEGIYLGPREPYEQKDEHSKEGRTFIVYPAAIETIAGVVVFGLLKDSRPKLARVEPGTRIRIEYSGDHGTQKLFSVTTLDAEGESDQGAGDDYVDPF